AAGQVLAEVRLAETEHSRKRCSDRLALDDRVQLADARLALPEVGGGPIELRLRDDPSPSSPWIRSKVIRASSRWASRAASCARSWRVSSSASRSPAWTN